MLVCGEKTSFAWLLTNELLTNTPYAAFYDEASEEGTGLKRRTEGEKL